MRTNRVITGLITTIVVIIVLVADHYVSRGRGFIFSAALALVAYTAAAELCIILEAAGLRPFHRLTSFFAFAVALMPSAWFMISPLTGADASHEAYAAQAGVIFGFMILTFAVAMQMKHAPLPATQAVISSTFVLVYVGLALSFFVRLRYLPDFGEPMLYLALGVAKGGDAGAYFAGKKFGRRQLAPTLSPKKTVEGVFGAVATSLVVGAVVWYFFLGEHKPLLPMWVFLVWAVILSAAAQFGDLAESLLKRAAGIKDSGGVFAKMGGALDVVDSLLFCAPVAYILALVGELVAR